MKRFLSLLMASLLILSCFTLFACGGESNESGQSKVLRICNCEDYIDEELLEKFTQETGIQVEYSTFGTNENLYNELVINPNSYDLVVPSEYMIEKLAQEGRLNRLDLSRVPSYTANVSQYINKRLGDIKVTVEDGVNKGKTLPLTDFMVGYMWGTMGWVYNTEFVAEEQVSTWEGVFADQSLSKKITIKDAVRDSYIVGLAMVYKDELLNATSTEQITQILNRVDQDSIDKVGAKLNSLKPMLYGFEVDSGKNDIVLGNIYAYVAWSGDAAYAIDVACGDVEDEDGTFVDEKNLRDLSYKIPEEGSNIWFDGMVMPSGSTNYDAVYKFMDFISRPENVAENMDYIGYTSLVAGDTIFNDVVLEWFDESEDLAVDEGVTVDLSYFFGEGDYTVKVSEESLGRLMAQYPTLDILEKCAIMQNFKADTLLSINDMWEGVKGETFPTWVIILIAGLVVLLAVAIVFYRKKDKIKWFKLPGRKQTRLEKKGYKAIKKENI